MPGDLPHSAVNAVVIARAPYSWRSFTNRELRIGPHRGTDVALRNHEVNRTLVSAYVEESTGASYLPERTGSKIYVENVDPGAIQTLLDDIERLKAMITALTGPSGLKNGQFDQARATVLASSEKFDSDRWSRLSGQRQRELQEQLIRAREALLDLARRAGSDGAGQVVETALSARSVVWLAIFGFIFAATLLSLIR